MQSTKNYTTAWIQIKYLCNVKCNILYILVEQIKKALTQAPLLMEHMSVWLKEWVRATFPLCSLLWLMALWELRASGSWMWVGGFEEQDHRGNTKQQECILEGQVRLTLKVAIQSYALSTAYCVGFLWRHVIKEGFTANIHGWNVHICVNITGFNQIHYSCYGG